MDGSSTVENQKRNMRLSRYQGRRGVAVCDAQLCFRTLGWKELPAERRKKKQNREEKKIINVGWSKVI